MSPYWVFGGGGGWFRSASPALSPSRSLPPKRGRSSDSEDDDIPSSTATTSFLLTHSSWAQTGFLSGSPCVDCHLSRFSINQVSR